MTRRERQAKIDEFRTLDFAAISFRQSLALCEHLIELNLTAPTALFSGCMAGIVVLYAKPFGNNRGLGKFPIEYSQGFPSVEMEESHVDLLHCRDKIYAHRDIAGANYTARGTFVPNLHTSRVKIFPSVDGKPRRLRTCPVLPDILPGCIPEIIELINFQLDRVASRINKLLGEIGDTTKYPPGVYTVGDEFP